MEQASRCTHPEAYVTGLVDEFGNLFSAHVVGHDCEYIEARNSLIPFAEAKANKAVGRAAPVVGRRLPRADEAHSAYVQDWNRAFFAEMNRLWAARCTSVQQQHQVAA